MVHHRQSGFTLLEAMVALGIVAVAVLYFLGQRTGALQDAMQARDWRLARELAEQKLSELNAGAREVAPESGSDQPFEHYPGFHYKILIGESAVNQLESERANAAASDTDRNAGDRAEWQQNRDLYRKASQQGLSAVEYQDKLREDEYQRQRQEKAPTDTDLEDVAVVVYFPKLSAKVEHQDDDTFVLKAKVSSLALSCLTPDQAKVVADAKGQTPAPTPGQPGGASPSAGSSAGGKTTDGGKE